MTTTNAAAEVTITGASALVFALLGVEPQALVYGVAGCVLGIGLAKPTGMLHAVGVFLAATLACSLFGTVLADQFFGGSKGWRNFLALCFGSGFHIILAQFFAAIPGVMDAIKSFVIRRVGGGQ